MKKILLPLIITAILLSQGYASAHDESTEHDKSTKVTGQLWLEPIGGTYTSEHPDSWLKESWVIGYGEFILNITNHHQHETIEYLYILTAINSDPSNVSVRVNNVLIQDWKKASGKPEVPTNPEFEYPPHGIYNDEAWYNITKFAITIPSNGNITIPINTSGPGKIHFDAVGADVSNQAIVFVPPSHDVTSIPEFPIVILPVASILVIMLLLKGGRQWK